MQVPCIFFLFSQNIRNKRHLLRTSTRLYPGHITLPLPHDHFPYLQTPKCQSQSKMHSTGESRLECLIRNQHLGEEKTGKHFAWGTGPIHTPSLSTSRTQSSAGQGAAVPLCIIPLPSALTATWKMLQRGQEQAVCPPQETRLMPTGVNSLYPRYSWCWIYYLTVKKERAEHSKRQWAKHSKRQRDGAEEGGGRCTQAFTTSERLYLLDLRFLTTFRKSEGSAEQHFWLRETEKQKGSYSTLW